MTDETATGRFALDVRTVEDVAPSMTATDGGQSFQAMLFGLADADAGVHLWRAEPGSYEHPGSSSGEVFVVVDGRAELTLRGGEPSTIAVGTVVRIPPDTPSTMRVTAQLQKVSLDLS